MRVPSNTKLAKRYAISNTLGAVAVIIGVVLSGSVGYYVGNSSVPSTVRTITTTQTVTVTSTTTEPSRYGGTLVIGAEKQEDSLDPLNALTGPFAGTGMQAIFEPLIYYGPGGKIIPGLATSWKAESDLVWVFSIRQGVTFQDGTPLNASAVKMSFDRHIANPKAVKSIAFLLSAVKVRNQTAVEFDLNPNGPYADFLTYLTFDVYGLVVSPTAVNHYGDKAFARNPVGTGPFKFVEWVDNDHLTLAANTNYWGGRPYLDQITVRIIPDASVRVLALKSGEIQLTDLPAQSVKDANASGTTVKVGGNFRLFMMPINQNANGNPVFKDVRLRQAINYAVNRTALIAGVELGFATPATGSLVPGLNDPFYNSSIPGYPANGNITKAKQLLVAAGYPNGIDVVIESAGAFANGLQIATILQQQLAQANIRVTIKNVDFSVFIADLFRNRNYDVAIHDQAGASPYNLFQSILYSKGRNLANLNDSQLDALINQLGVTADIKKQQALASQVTQLEIQKAYNIYLYYVPRIQAWSNKLVGYTVTDPHYWGNTISSQPRGVNVWLRP